MVNGVRQTIIGSICLLVCICLTNQAFAATYYVDGQASTDLGSGSSSNPKKYIQSGIKLLTAGDTLIVKNGTYTTSSDCITSVPNGTSSNYVTIRAENDGGAIITASGGLSLDHTDQYIRIEGFKFDYANQKTILGNHIKLLRCSFSGGYASGNTVQVCIGTSDYSDTEYILLEDCWFYGPGGRYNLLVYNSNYVILRRCVIRHDGGWSDTKGDPEAGTNAYSSSYVYYQNCIVLDSNLGTYYNWYAPFYGTADGSESNVSWQGCISLNNRNAGYQIDPKSGGALNNLSINNCVSYGNGWGVTLGSQGTVNGTVTNMTIGSIPSYDGIAKWNSAGTVTVKNSIIYNVGGNALRGVSGTFCNTYGTGSNGSGTGFTFINPTSNGLNYLPRIENGSVLKTSGEDKTQVGAQVTHKIGVSGTLYGEQGWNDVSNTDSLWPFPNQARIRSDMRTVSTRGFCADNITLTGYIWEYLGNVPTDISAASDSSKPGKPTTPTLTYHND